MINKQAEKKCDAQISEVEDRNKYLVAINF